MTLLLVRRYTVCGRDLYTGWSTSVYAMQYPVYLTIPTQLMIWRWLSQNTFGIWTVLYWTRTALYWTRTVLYWTRCSKTQYGVSINVWRLAGDSLNIICNFLYCNYQVQRDFFITLYIHCCGSGGVMSWLTSRETGPWLYRGHYRNSSLERPLCDLTGLRVWKEKGEV
jgi:hypothetical protein